MKFLERSEESYLESRAVKSLLQLPTHCIINANQMERGGCVYIVANRRRTVYYIGVTTDLGRRAYKHKQGAGSTFTKKYRCTDLIYYEIFPRIEEAIAWEKQLKKWHRAWKEELICKMNPTLRDLYDEVRRW